MLLIIRCMPPPMVGFGRARKPKDFFIFALDDGLSSPCFPYKNQRKK
jgi:hypothetical protein